MSAEGVQSRGEAIGLAEQHSADVDPEGYGYEHCTWCGNEWPCVTAKLLEIVRAGVVTEELECEYGVISRQRVVAPAGNLAHARSMAARDIRYQGWEVARRRKAGPWVPVKQEGART